MKGIVASNEDIKKLLKKLLLYVLDIFCYTKRYIIYRLLKAWYNIFIYLYSLAYPMMLGERLGKQQLGPQRPWIMSVQVSVKIALIQ